jgi:hypothetical protein
VNSRAPHFFHRFSALSALLLVAACGERGATAPDNAVANATYVGGAACVQCHAKESTAWASSQHAGAMKHAADSTVLGNFDNASFNDGRVTTRFSRRDGRFVVKTEGPDGKPHDYDVKYTFGLFPLSSTSSTSTTAASSP